MGISLVYIGINSGHIYQFVDDIRSTSQRLRLVFHFSAMTLMFYQWGLFSLSWWWMIIALIICTGIINAYNSWMVLMALQVVIRWLFLVH